MNKVALSKTAMLLVVVLAQFHSPVFAQAACKEPAGRFASIEGQVQIRGDEQQTWRAAKSVDPLCKGDTIRVGELSRAAIVLVNEAVLRLDQNTTMRLVDISGKKENRSLIELAKGAIKSFIRKPRLLSVNTPYLNGSIEGTEFQVAVAEDRASILVFEGRILASNDQGKVAINPGEIAEAQAGAAPTSRILVKPRDAVQWTLYYPPIQATPGGSGEAAPDIETLDKVAESGRDAAWHLQRATLLLSVGRQDEAGADIDAALNLDPKAGLGHALRAIIHVVRNEREQALAEADKGVALSDTAATRIALSYAQQADFRIEAARDTLLAAVDKSPQDALAWARLSELWLMLGDKEQSRAAAAKGLSLAPDLARTQLVVGYAALSDYHAAEARAAFERAIERSPADPLAHLGLGLAQISAGQLETGRAELEVAVALDSSQALLRSYLGKAYFEEKRTPLDEQQFGIAKQLDPLDPTPYLYDGLRKQTRNRPVEALEDLEQSIALNDNRAVYRSRLLLDSDRAARGASLARVYSDLGFQELALVEGWKSVNADPGNYSAHRFLSDSYAALPRHEIARVSELLQSQLLQPLNLTPIQPRLAEGDQLLIGSGPTSAGFNEYNSLFNRNGTSFLASAFFGSHETNSEDVVFSGIFNDTSFSMGLSHLETEGWRKNADQKDDIANIFWQKEISAKTSVQAEYRYRKKEYGDLLMRFFPDEFYPGQENDVERHTLRVGGRHDFSENSTILGSFVYQKADTSLKDRKFPNPFFADLPIDTLDLFSDIPENAYSAEVQHLYKKPNFKLTSGLGYFHINGTLDLNVNADLTPLDPELPDKYPLISAEIPTRIRHVNAYSYAYINPIDDLTLTLGGSVDSLSGEFPGGDKNQFNPKLGLTWNPSPRTTIRAAAFKTLKRTLITNQTLEPTQVAGFNQFYDDYNLTEAWRYGVAVDQKFSRKIFGGIELSKRDMKVLETVSSVKVDWDERIGRAYLFWTPLSQLALKMGYSDERSTRDEYFPEGIVELDTKRLDLGMNYFNPNGLGATLNAAYIDQDGDFRGIYNNGRGGDQFWIVDAALNYRLPARKGFITVGASNIFDKSFNYFDIDLNKASIQPSRMLFIKGTLVFD